MKLELLLEKEMFESLVKLELLLQEKNSPQFGSPMFPLQIASRW
jgi:hypothetical protein